MSFLCCLEILFPQNDSAEKEPEKQNEHHESNAQCVTASVHIQPSVTPAPTIQEPQTYSQAAGRNSELNQGKRLPTATIVSSATQDTLHSIPAEQARYRSADEIPDSVIKRNAVLLGVATKFIDGDTIKFYHKLDHHDETCKSIHILRQETFTVRLAGIDCPETDHGDEKKGQPFGKEAASFLQNLIENKPISIQILDRDQYGRIVARVLDPSGRDCSKLLLENGLAYMYKGKGAVYGGKESIYSSALNDSKLKKIGIWSVSNLQTPSEYKKQQKK